MATLYVADQLSHPPPPDPPIGFGNIYRLTSAPTSDLGSDGDGAIDTTTGIFYVKSNGAWAASVGIVGALSQSGSGSPVGVNVPDYVGQGYTDTDAPYHQWFAIGLTNADWFEIV